MTVTDDRGETPSEKKRVSDKKRGLGQLWRPTFWSPAWRKWRKGRTGPEPPKWKHSNIWWIKYSYRGQRYGESSGSTNRMDAVRLLKQRLGEIGRGHFIGPDAEKVTVADLATMLKDHYSANERRSLGRAEDALNRLQAFFGSLTRAVDVTSDRIDGYVDARRKAQARPGSKSGTRVAAATIAYELAILKRAFNLAVRNGRLPHRPYVPSLHLNNARKGFFEDGDLRVVLDHLPEDVRPLVAFLAATGWRVGEARTLTWGQVDFRAQVVRLETSKNEEARTFPFSTLPELAHLLEGQRERTLALEMALGRIIPYVFHRRGAPIRYFKTAWRNACTAAGVPGRIVHDLRRTAVRNLERAGVPRSVAMKLTGHKTESVYRRYAIVSEADLSEGLAKLARLQEALGGQQGDRKVLPLLRERK